MENIIYQEDTEDEDLNKAKAIIKEIAEKEENDPDKASE